MDLAYTSEREHAVQTPSGFWVSVIVNEKPQNLKRRYLVFYLLFQLIYDKHMLIKFGVVEFN